eukprot:289899-Prymnesium_polylepis.1
MRQRGGRGAVRGRGGAHARVCGSRRGLLRRVWGAPLAASRCAAVVVRGGGAAPRWLRGRCNPSPPWAQRDGAAAARGRRGALRR